MKRSSKIKIGLILAGAAVLVVLGTLLDEKMRADGEPGGIAGNVYMLVLVGTVGLLSAVVVTDRNRPVATADDGTRSQALSLTAKPGLAQVVVFRDDQIGGLIGADVKVGDRLHTQLTSPGFTVIDLAPGSHRIVLEWQKQRAEHTLDAKDGDVVALYVKMRMGLASTTPSLEPVALDRARRMIGKAPMALPITAST